MAMEQVGAVAVLERKRPATIANIIAERAFVTAFQPIMDLRGLRTVGVEALTRFLVEPFRGPRPWFAAAESVGLGLELELAAARAALARLPDIPPSVFMSVNVAPDTISSPALSSLLDEFPDPRIVLEVTEHAAVTDYDVLRAGFREAQTRGARLAIDDVGAGFATFEHVMSLTPEYIKLDISVTGACEASDGAAFVRAVVSYANVVGAAVIAEGIETREQLHGLRRCGVHLGQGFLLARPEYLPRAQARKRA